MGRGWSRSTTTKVLFYAAVIRPTAPGLHSAANNEARNHDAENKKQNLNQISGVLWHRASFPSRDDTYAAYSTGDTMGAGIAAVQCWYAELKAPLPAWPTLSTCASTPRIP